VFRDVIEARRAMEARLYLAGIVESSDDAIVGQTLDGRIASWNKGAQRLFGYSAAEILGEPLALLVPADHPDELPGITERIRRGESIDHFETQRVRKDGTRLDVSLTGGGGASARRVLVDDNEDAATSLTACCGCWGTKCAWRTTGRRPCRRWRRSGRG
jgi:PAS domain S-box-containing protein